MAHSLRVLAFALAAAAVGAAVGYVVMVVYLDCCNGAHLRPYPRLGAAVGALVGFTIGWLRRAESRLAA